MVSDGLSKFMVPMTMHMNNVINMADLVLPIPGSGFSKFLQLVFSLARIFNDEIK